MKRKGFRSITLFLLISTILCGCGTPVYEMTEEEEAVIVRYAAYVLAKHNIYQKDGMVAVNPELIQPESVDAPEPEAEPEEPETEQVQDESTTPENNTDNSPVELPQEEPENAISLADAVGYDGQLNITYKGFAVADNYQEGKVYSLDAHTGYDFVIAKFEAENISGATLDVNVMRQNVTFKLSYDGSKWVKEDVTLLLTDLSTYTGSLGIGEKIDLVLLFEVPDDKANSIEKVRFLASKDGEDYLISQ